MGRRKQRVRWTSVEDQFFIARDSTERETTTTKAPFSNPSVERDYRYREGDQPQVDDRQYRPWRSYYQPRRSFYDRGERPAAFAPRFERQASAEADYRRRHRYRSNYSESDLYQQNVPDGFAKVCSKNLDVLFKKNYYLERSQSQTGSVTCDMDHPANLNDVEEEEEASSMVDPTSFASVEEHEAEAGPQAGVHEQPQEDVEDQNTKSVKSSFRINRHASPFYPSSYFNPQPMFPAPGSGASLYLYSPATNTLVPCEEIVIPHAAMEADPATFNGGQSKIYLSFPPYPAAGSSGSMVSPGGISPHDFSPYYGPAVPYEAPPAIPLLAPAGATSVSLSGADSSPPAELEDVAAVEDIRLGTDEPSHSPPVDLSYFAPENWAQQEMFFDADWYDDQFEQGPMYFNGDQAPVDGSSSSGQVQYFRKPFYMRGRHQESFPYDQPAGNETMLPNMPVNSFGHVSGSTSNPDSNDPSSVMDEPVNEDTSRKSTIPGLPVSYANVAAAAKKARKKRPTTPPKEIKPVAKPAPEVAWVPPPAEKSNPSPVIDSAPPKKFVDKKFVRGAFDRKSRKTTRAPCAAAGSATQASSEVAKKLSLPERPMAKVTELKYDEHEWEAIPEELMASSAGCESWRVPTSATRKNRKQRKPVLDEVLAVVEETPCSLPDKVRCPSPVPEVAEELMAESPIKPEEATLPTSSAIMTSSSLHRSNKPRKKKATYDEGKNSFVRPVYVQDGVDDLMAELEELQKRLVINSTDDLSSVDNAFLIKDIGMGKLLHGPMALGRLRTSSVSSPLSASEILASLM